MVSISPVPKLDPGPVSYCQLPPGGLPAAPLKSSLKIVDQPRGGAGTAWGEAVIRAALTGGAAGEAPGRTVCDACAAAATRGWAACAGAACAAGTAATTRAGAATAARM